MKASISDTDPLSRIIRETLYTKKQVDARIEEMAFDLRHLYQGERPLFLGVALGGVIFTKELTAAISRQDPSFNLDIAYITASTYPEGSSSAGKTEVRSGLRPPNRVEGRDVIMLDDVLDKGDTAEQLVEYVRDKDANSVDFIPLVRKAVPEQKGPDPLRVGLGAPNEWLLGKGMDWNGLGRNLGYIAIMDPAAGQQLLDEGFKF